MEGVTVRLLHDRPPPMLLKQGHAAQPVLSSISGWGRSSYNSALWSLAPPFAQNPFFSGNGYFFIAS
jgi:hypothetical protein